MKRLRFRRRQAHSHRVGRVETGSQTPGSKLETPLATSDTWGFPASRPISGEPRSCQWSLRQDLSTAQTGKGLRGEPGPGASQPGSHASMALLLLAPMGSATGKNRQEQQPNSCGQGAQLPLSFLPPKLSPSASWRRRKGQAGSSSWLSTSLWKTELEIRGRAPSFRGAPCPLSS